MARSTATVTIGETATHGYIIDEIGEIPWDEVSEECSFNDATLSRVLYPDVKVRADLGEQRPPVRMFNRTSKRFPIGLMGRVVRALSEQGVAVTRADSLPEPTAGFNFEWKGHTPRDYQERAVNAAIAGNRFGIISVPTGGGKTLIGAKLINTLGLRTLWIVHSSDLLKQTAEFIKSYLGIKAGTIGAGKMKVGTITVATAQSLQRGKVDELINVREWKPDLLINDEVHHAGAWKTHQMLCKIPAFYRYGLTATPERIGADTLVLEASFGGVVSEIGLGELQERGFVAPITIRAKTIPGSVEASTLNTWEKIYRAGIVEYAARNSAIRDAVAELRLEGRQILVDVDEIDHISELAIPNGVPVTGSVSAEDRGDIYDDFRAGKHSVLVGTVLREGIDLPNVGAVVLAGGKKSKVRLLQEIGRGFRPSAGKVDCVIVDFVDSHHSVLFAHCQARFKALQDNGFAVPEGVIRKVEVDGKIDEDEIEKVRKKQKKLRYKTRYNKKKDDGFDDDI